MSIPEMLDKMELAHARDKMKDCKHEWYVFSTTGLQRSLMVEYRKCRRCGFVEDPTGQDWKDACNA